NWIGQDYFAPQAFGFLLFLVIFAVVLRWYRRPDVPAARGRGKAWRDRPGATDAVKPRLPGPHGRTVAFLWVGLLAAPLTRHPPTPVVICACLGMMTVFRALDRRWPVFAIVGLTLLWFVTGARSFVVDNLSQLLSGFGQLSSNVNSNLANLGALSHQQQIVA